MEDLTELGESLVKKCNWCGSPNIVVNKVEVTHRHYGFLGMNLEQVLRVHYTCDNHAVWHQARHDDFNADTVLAHIEFRKGMAKIKRKILGFDI